MKNGRFEKRRRRPRLRHVLLRAAVMSIIATTVAVGLLFHFTGPSDDETSAMQRAGARALASLDRPALEGLARDIARSFDVGIVLSADGGDVPFGPACGRHARVFRLSLPDAESGVREIGACTAGDRRGPSVLLLALGVTLLILSFFAGVGARRIARPIRRVARVARRLGEGHLAERVAVSDKTPREIAQMADALNTMAARIETQLADQRALLAAVSHEVRTPLGHLRLLVETGQDLGPDHTRLDAMALELDAMETLVARLLAHSRLEFESLTPAVLDARDEALRAVRRAGLDASLVVGESGHAVETDATLLAQALANLIDNATLHGGGLVALRIEASEGHVRFIVEDRGDGVPEDRKPEPTSSPAPSPHGGTGLGLGLPLVARIAEALGGALSFAPGRVTISLSSAPPPKAADALRG